MRPDLSDSAECRRGQHCPGQQQGAHQHDGSEPPQIGPSAAQLRRESQRERADHETIGYSRWRADRTYLLVPAQVFVGEFLATFKEYPPRQKAASFSLDKVMEKLESPGGSH